jgi:hypothetical protein
MRLQNLVRTTASEKHTAILSLPCYEDGSSMFPRNVGNHVYNFSTINLNTKMTILFRKVRLYVTKCIYFSLGFFKFSNYVRNLCSSIKIQSQDRNLFNSSVTFDGCIISADSNDILHKFNVFHVRALYHTKTLIANKCTKRVLTSIVAHSYMFRPWWVIFREDFPLPLH